MPKSSATANPVLTGHAEQFLQSADGYVAGVLFPVFNTGEQSSDYYIFDTENMLNVPANIRHAPGAPFGRTRPKISDDNFNCHDYGHEEPVPDTERAKYASYLDADVAAVRRITDIILLAQEKRVHAMATSGAVPTSTPGTKWDQANSDPIGDVKTARETVRLGCGMRPNTLVMSEPVMNVLEDHPDFIERIKYSQTGVTTPQIMARLFGVERIAVAGALHNAAAEGQALSVQDIWNDSVILAHVQAGQDLRRPNFGRRFVWTRFSGANGGAQVTSYRDEPVESDIHRARHFTDEKLVGPKCGFHLSDALAAA